MVRASASGKRPPMPIRCCWRSIRGPRRSGETGRRSRDSAIPTALPRRTFSPCWTPRPPPAPPSRTTRSDLDALLVNVIGLLTSGIDLIGPNKDNLVNAINTLEPTTSLLMKYDPQLTCTLIGGQYFLDNGFVDVAGSENGSRSIVDAAMLLGDDLYRYPDNLPINGAKGGPGGKPGCGSLPDVAKNWPVRYLVTNTGWGTGVDVRPNPGIGIPRLCQLSCRRLARSPNHRSIRYPGPPAPGPIPYPGAPPYGAAPLRA